MRAVEECFPRSHRQRCLAHRMRNLEAKVPEHLWPEVRARAKAAYEAPSPEANALRDDFITRYARELPAAVQCFGEDFAACTAHLRFPIGHRKVIRTTNLLERLFGEAAPDEGDREWVRGAPGVEAYVRGPDPGDGAV